MRFFPKRAVEETPRLEMRNISAETFGKYQHCTQYDGVWYADSDFTHGGGVGKPKLGAIPSPREEDRTPFGQRRRPILETEAQKRTRWKREKEETHTLLEQLASELVAEVQAQQPSWFEQYMAEYERDVAGYTFACQRHGDFLTLHITRSGNPTSPHPYAFLGARADPRKLSTTINLSNCREIRCLAGHPPDLDGEVTFGYRCEHDSGGATIGGTGFGNYAAPKGAKWVVSKPESWVPHGRPLFMLDPPPEKDRGMVIDGSADNYRIRTTVTQAARIAADDRIRFEGSGATLFAPAGLGEDAHRKILLALSN